MIRSLKVNTRDEMTNAKQEHGAIGGHDRDRVLAVPLRLEVSNKARHTYELRQIGGTSDAPAYSSSRILDTRSAGSRWQTCSTSRALARSERCGFAIPKSATEA